MSRGEYIKELEEKLVDRHFFVLARRKGSDEFYQFVSYDRIKGTGRHTPYPIDIRTMMHDAGDFAVQEDYAYKAKELLEERNYEVVIARLNRGNDSIDLDQMTLEVEMSKIIKELEKRAEKNEGPS